MELNTIQASAPAGVSGASRSAELGAQDFLKLLVTQLQNQDPLEPTSNENLLQQLASINEIQLSSSLVDSLKALTGNQRYGAAAALIGKFVSGHVGDEIEGQQAVSGVVVGTRFGEDGSVTLKLDSGVELPLANLELVEDPLESAESLIGQHVRGTELNDDGEVEFIEGVVTEVRVGDDGAVMLELDTGRELRMSQLIPAA